MPSIIEHVLKERGAWPVVPPRLTATQQRLMPYEVMNLLDRIGSEAELEEVWEQSSPAPDWTYHDVLAHIATGDWVCQEILRRVLQGQDLEEFIGRLDLDGTNARLVEERRDAGVASLAYEYVGMRWETFNLMAQLAPEILDGTTIHWRHRHPYRPEWGAQTLQEYLDGFWRHEAHHRQQLATALERHGP